MSNPPEIIIDANSGKISYATWEPYLERKVENLNLKAKEPVHEQYICGSGSR
ncbi:hypothetical protein Glove_153g17 [Diversispora epigaea]|uniref:Uncharacterized protein n=1 Tax=Diversispora epigaea TaxID=1348612 RepID=A0A397ISN1_9GLOM|nr:hypothetical protein Glove_153g17 [Diversispora epigaea]